jgi:hypothetical protein
MRRLRACWAVHCPVGCRATPRMRMRRVAWVGHGQDIGLGAAGQAGRDEVARQDRLGPGAQESRPPRPALPGGVDAAGREDLPPGRRCDVAAQASQLAVDPSVPPVGVIAGQPADQGLDVAPGRRPARPGVRRPGGPAAARDVLVPGHDRVRGNQQPQAPAALWVSRRAGHGLPSSAAGDMAVGVAGR